MAAILLERNLQSVANYLIISLAFADLMVACLVMPLGAVYEVRKPHYIPRHSVFKQAPRVITTYIRRIRYTVQFKVRSRRVGVYCARGYARRGTGCKGS